MIFPSEKKLTLTQAARQLDVNPSTVWRWALNGCRGVQLETFSIGAKRFTSAESIERFVTATTQAASNRPMPSVAARTPKKRERDIARAEAELAAQGI